MFFLNNKIKIKQDTEANKSGKNGPVISKIGKIIKENIKKKLAVFSISIF